MAPSRWPTSNAEFLTGVFNPLPSASWPVLCGFAGNPHDRNDPRTNWTGHPWAEGCATDNPALNWYFTLGTYGHDGAGRVDRDKDRLATIYGVLVDDIGTRAPLSRLDSLPPSVLTMTSAGNFQALYLFDRPSTDRAAVYALQSSLIAAGLSDPAAHGPATRYARMPFASNRKRSPPQSCYLVEWHPERRYSIDAIMRGLNLPTAAPRTTLTLDVPTEGPRPDWRGPTDDVELLRRAMQSKSAAGVFGSKATFADLWHANVAKLAATYPPEATSSDPFDMSDADAALASHLAFWCGCDVARIERLMRQSALVRPKWDEHASYLVGYTITNACGIQRDVLQDPPSADDVERLLAPMTADEIGRQWASLAAQLKPEDRARVIEFVAHRTHVGKQPLKEALRDVRTEQQREARAAATANDAGNRTVIDFKPEDLSRHAAHVEQLIVASARPGEYVAFSGVLCHVVTKSLPYTHLIDSTESEPPAVTQIEPLDKVAIRERVERVAVFAGATKTGPKAIEVPAAIFDILIQKKMHAAPTVNGLVTHPIVLHDGAVLSQNGLHAPTGLYLSGATVANVRAYSQGEAGTALATLRQTFLSEFEFASTLDADIALAGLFTGVQRRLMDSAPGLAVLASTQSSGKTTLARRMHVVLTGRDMPVSTFPEGNEDEAQKRLLSMLLRSPVMICLDNISDGFTFRSGSLAAAMTSSSFTQRLLGVSRDADCLTNTLFVMTGNNLSFGRDESSRWIVARLAPTAARPEQRVFRNADVLAHGLAIRDQVLRDVVGIVAGFIASGTRWQTRSRFPTWDRFVRQPLGWAGTEDVAGAFDRNAESSEDVRAHCMLLSALIELFGDREFTAGDVTRIAFAKAGLTDAVNEALVTLGAREAATHSPRSIGRVFAKLIKRVVTVEAGEVCLESQTDRKGVMLYRCRVCRV